MPIPSNSPPVSYFGTVPLRLVSEGISKDAGSASSGRAKITCSSPPSDEVLAPGDVLKSSSSTRPKEKRTLWLGDLECADSFADEDYVRNHMFFEFQYCIRNIRICKDRVTGQPSYGFIEFSNQMQAQYVLEHMNGRFVPGRSHKYKLNWANFNLTEKSENKATYSNPPVLNANKAEEGKRSGTSNPCNGESFSIWVGSLDPATTREDIEDLFLQKYKSVCFVKVVTDPNTGLGRGFAFVHFRDETESERALIEMNGALCRGKRIRVNRSNTRNASVKPSNGQGENVPLQNFSNGYNVSVGYSNIPGTSHPDASAQSALNKLYLASAAHARQIASEYCGSVALTKRKRGFVHGEDPTRVAIRGLDTRCTEEQLQKHFEAFGDILHMKIVAGKKSVISFAEPNAALNSVLYMNGAFIGGKQVFLELVDPEGGATQKIHCSSESRQMVSSINFQIPDSHFSESTHPWIETPLWEEYSEHQNLAMSHHSSLLWTDCNLPSSYLAGLNDQLPANARNFLPVNHPDQQNLPSGKDGTMTAKTMKSSANDIQDDIGFFSDVDPNSVPAEMLPQTIFDVSAMTCKGTMEKHIFDAIINVDIKIDLKKDEKDSFKLINEDSAIFAMIRSRQNRKLHRRRMENAVRPEDYETLYASTFYHDWDFIS